MALQNQGEQSQLFHEGTSGTDIINSTNGQPSSLASGNDTLRDNEVMVSGNQNHTVCRLRNLEDELMSEQNRNRVLQEQLNSQWELLNEVETEKKQLQVELGRYLFVEEKQKRLNYESRQSAAGSAAPPVPRRVAIDPCDPSLTLQTKLLQISDSLTADELKRMKFLAKGKVNGFRLARIREGFELFEELETDGEYQLTFIGQLLERIDRFDLLEKLGLPLSEIVRSADSCRQERDVGEETSPERTAFVRSGLSTQTPSDDTSRDSSDSSSRLSSSTSHSAAATTDISSDSGCNTTSSEDEIIPKSQLPGNEDIVSESGTAAVVGACAANSEDRKKNSLDSCDGPGTTSNTRMTVLDSEVNSTDNSVHGHSRAQDSSDERNGSPLQQRLLDCDETALGVSSRSSTDWERPGARPELVQIHCQTPDGIADTFLARHSEDDTILGRLYRGNLSNRSTPDWESLDTQPSPLQGQHLLAETRPETISPLSDGITWDFLLRHSQDPTVLERVVARQEAITATPFLCSHCFHEQEVDGNSCGRNMPAYRYVCFNCGGVSCTEDVPYRCEMCGICRIQTEKACQDQCCFCLEDAFSGRQWLPCSHIVHEECLLAMIQDGIIACPICRYSLYNPSGW